MTPVARPISPRTLSPTGDGSGGVDSTAAALEAMRTTVTTVLRHPDRHVFEIAGPGAARHYAVALAAGTVLAVQHGRSVVLRLVDDDATAAATGVGISRSHPWRAFARLHGRVSARMVLTHARRLAAIAAA